MIYGLYLSAAGVMTNAYRQDVISNNLANAETIGFKRNLAGFQQRRTEAEERGDESGTNALLENIGGGVFASPTRVDLSQGELETSSNNLDVALEGSGYFSVRDHDATRLTRDGRFMINRDRQLIMANGVGQQVLSDKGDPIVLPEGASAGNTVIGKAGEVITNGQYVSRIGVQDAADPSKLRKLGGNLISADGTDLQPSAAVVHGGALERANVEPATELVELMDTQRQLEANANMIRIQDSSLQHAANEVGKIS
jgi:flagellar basal-body rod protein FlgF